MTHTSTAFTVRPASHSDAEKLQEILRACDIDEFGTADFMFDIKETLDELLLETNTWVVEEHDRIVGFGFVEEKGKGRLDTFVFVHPDHKGKGLGTFIVELTEKRAKEQIDEYITSGISEYAFNNVVPINNEGARSILESRGYALTRTYSQMSIDFDNLPENPAFPDSISVLPCTLDQKQALYDVYVDAFQDSRGHFTVAYDEWQKEKPGEKKEPKIWYAAYLNEEMVGFIFCSPLADGTMWIDLLGVRRTSRKLGLGMALLKLAFHESYKAGFKRVALTVDAESLTNANKLYERAGMHIVFGLAMYSKALN